MKTDAQTAFLTAQVAAKAAAYKLRAERKPRAVFVLPADDQPKPRVVASRSLSGDFADFVC